MSDLPPTAQAGLSFERLQATQLDEALARELSELDTVPWPRHDHLGYWRWRYFGSPLGSASVVLARRAGRLIGKLASVHMQLESAGQPVVAGLSEGLFIRPEERNWAVLRGLLAESLAAGSDAQLAFGYGFVTPLAAELNRQCGWGNLGRLPILSGFLDLRRALLGRKLPGPLGFLGRLGQPLLGVKRAGSAPPGLRIARLKNFDACDGQLASTRRDAVRVVKDARYLSWRYTGCPALEYQSLGAFAGDRLVGLVVFRGPADKHDGFLLELQAQDDDPHTLRWLAGHALEALREREVGLVSACFPEPSAAAQALRELGFVSWGTELWAMDLLVASDPAGNGPELDGARWDYSLGDWLYH